jgi:hypothetical protein
MTSDLDKRRRELLLGRSSVQLGEKGTIVVLEELSTVMGKTELTKGWGIREGTTVG